MPLYTVCRYDAKAYLPTIKVNAVLGSSSTPYLSTTTTLRSLNWARRENQPSKHMQCGSTWIELAHCAIVVIQCTWLDSCRYQTTRKSTSASLCFVSVWVLCVGTTSESHCFTLPQLTLRYVFIPYERLMADFYFKKTFMTTYNLQTDTKVEI